MLFNGASLLADRSADTAGDDIPIAPPPRHDLLLGAPAAGSTGKASDGSTVGGAEGGFPLLPGRCLALAHTGFCISKTVFQHQAGTMHNSMRSNAEVRQSLQGANRGRRSTPWRGASTSAWRSCMASWAGFTFRCCWIARLAVLKCLQLRHESLQGAWAASCRADASLWCILTAICVSYITCLLC